MEQLIKKIMSLGYSLSSEGGYVLDNLKINIKEAGDEVHITISDDSNKKETAIRFNTEIIDEKLNLIFEALQDQISALKSYQPK